MNTIYHNCKCWALMLCLLIGLPFTGIAQTELFEMVVEKTDGTEIVFRITDDYPVLQYIYGGEATTLDKVIAPEAKRAVYVFLRLRDKGAQRLAERSIPLAVVYKLCKFMRKHLLLVHRVLVYTYHLQNLVSAIKDSAAGRFVNAARLHAHKAVLHDIQ